MIYSTNWITESVKAGQLLPKDDFKLLKQGSGKQLEFDKGKLQYTIREVIIIYDWISDKKLKNSKRTWQVMAESGAIFCRTAESLKNFWKTNQKLSIEDCIEALLKKDAKYCHQYPNPIYPFDNAVIKRKEGNLVETSSDHTVTMRLFKNKEKNEETASNITGSVKKAIVNVEKFIDPSEDITPIHENLDFEIKVVYGVQSDSEYEDSHSEHKEEVDEEHNESAKNESHHESAHQDESEQNDDVMDDYQQYEQEILEVMESEEDEASPKSNRVNDSESEPKTVQKEQIEPDTENLKTEEKTNPTSSDKKKSDVSLSTPTKAEENKCTPNKSIPLIKSSQTSLSNFFEIHDQEIKDANPADLMQKVISSQDEQLNEIGSYMEVKNKLLTLSK